MNVLMFASHAYPKPLGAGQSALNLAGCLRSLGNTVWMLIDGSGSSAPRTFEQSGITFINLQLQEPKRWRRLIEWAFYLKFLLVRRNDFDLMYVSGPNYRNLALAFLFRCICRKPTIAKVTLDGSDSIEALSSARFGWLARQLFLRMDGVVTMTRSQTVKLDEAGFQGKTASISNGVDLRRFRPMTKGEKRDQRDKLNIPANARVLCYAGYLGPRKGTDILLDMFRRIESRVDDLWLLCVGNFSPTYESSQALKQFCRERGVDVTIVDHPRLIRLGRVEDMEAYLGCADLFIFPSRREGFGTVQIEAMACGLPCVVSYLPGITEEIYPDPEAVRIITSEDAADYAQAVCDLLDAPEQRRILSEKGLARVKERFSLEAVTSAYLAFFKELSAK